VRDVHDFESVVILLFQLKDKEKQYLAALAEEFKKRDKEREVITQKTVNK
jgi:hypothetical protein